MRKDIREHLLGLAEQDYQKFSAALIPGVENMLGIRLPALRTIAKEIAKSDWQESLKEEDYYFEERMLRGMVLSYVKGSMDEMLPYITEFIPLVDNWSVCDSVFMGMTIFQKDREKAWQYIMPYLKSDKEFEIRVALIIVMQHLLKCDRDGKKISRLRTVELSHLLNENQIDGLYIDRVLMEVDQVDTTAYYASMAAAWLIAEAFCCFPHRTYLYLQNNHLDNQTFHKAIQKIVESRIPKEDVKKTLRQLKRV